MDLYRVWNGNAWRSAALVKEGRKFNHWVWIEDNGVKIHKVKKGELNPKLLVENATIDRFLEYAEWLEMNSNLQGITKSAKEALERCQ